jgi:Oxidoreductase family, NAD-binding Rossmann fold
VNSVGAGGVFAPVRFGLVGYGFGARYFHAPLIASAVECDLVAVATRSGERRALVASEHPDAVVVDDLAGLVAAGAEAVTVSTPADTHIPLCRHALERGLPVVVDKPFALTAADARAAVELAERRRVLLSVYQTGFSCRSTRTGGGTPTSAPSKPSPQAAPSARSPGSSRASNAASPVPRPPAAAPCSTSAATWPTRHWCFAARSGACTPRCTTATTGSMMTSSSR